MLNDMTKTCCASSLCLIDVAPTMNVLALPLPIEISKRWCYVRTFCQHVFKTPAMVLSLIVKHLLQSRRVNAGMLQVWQTPAQLMFGSIPDFLP